jgi:hypothetical protein
VAVVVVGVDVVVVVDVVVGLVTAFRRESCREAEGSSADTAEVDSTRVAPLSSELPPQAVMAMDTLARRNGRLIFKSKTPSLWKRDGNRLSATSARRMDWGGDPKFSPGYFRQAN